MVFLGKVLILLNNSDIDLICVWNTYCGNVEQVQFRGIDTTLDHDEENSIAISHRERARAGKGDVENRNSEANDPGNHREISRQVHAQNVHKQPRGSSEDHYMLDIVMCTIGSVNW